MPRILLVEDEPGVRKNLHKLLEGAGYDVVEVTDFNKIEDTYTEMCAEASDLILMDLGLAGLSGLELLRRLRGASNTAVIILTANTTEANELLAMGYGADDFISKPFQPELLLLRIRAVLRRTLSGGQHDTYRLGEAEIDLARGVVTHDHRRAYLTKNEMIILRQLLEDRGRIVSREILMTELWNNQEYINDNALTVNVSRLRVKLKKISGKEAIETHKGIGYSLREES